MWMMPKAKRILLTLYFIGLAGISVWVPWKLTPPLGRAVSVPIGYSLICLPPTEPIEGIKYPESWFRFAAIDGMRIFFEVVCLSAFFGVGWLLLPDKRQL
jgi:hypothetical protein